MVIFKTIIINKEYACTSGLTANLNNWLSRTGRSHYMLNEITTQWNGLVSLTIL